MGMRRLHTHFFCKKPVQSQKSYSILPSVSSQKSHFRISKQLKTKTTENLLAFSLSPKTNAARNFSTISGIKKSKFHFIKLAKHLLNRPNLEERIIDMGQVWNLNSHGVKVHFTSGRHCLQHVDILGIRQHEYFYSDEFLFDFWGINEYNTRISHSKIVR